MRTYELALVLNEKTGKEATAKKLVTQILSSFHGKVKKLTSIGLRDLAYPIESQVKGWYVIFVVELPEGTQAKLDKTIKLKEEILRYLLVRTD